MNFTSVNSFSWIHSFIQRSGQDSLPSFLNKKIGAIALLVLAGLAACVLAYSICFRNRKVEEFEKKEEPKERIEIKTEEVAKEKILTPPPSPKPKLAQKEELKKEEKKETKEEEKVEIQDDKVEIQDDSEKKTVDQPSQPPPPPPISDWKELSTFFSNYPTKTDVLMAIPGLGILPTSVVVLLLAKQTSISWSSLMNPLKVKLVDGEYELQGWEVCVLSAYSSVDLIQSASPSLKFTKAQYVRLMRLLFSVDAWDNEQAILFALEHGSSMGFMFSSYESSLLNKNLYFEEDKIKTVVRIYQNVKNQSSNPLKEACESYFSKAMEQQGNPIATLYQYAQNDQEIVDYLFSFVIKKWEDYGTPTAQKTLLETHFIAILDALRSDEYVKFIETLLTKMKLKNFMTDGHFNKIFDHLTEAQAADTALIILKKAKQPFDLIFDLLGAFTYTDPKRQGKIEAIIEVTLLALKDVKDILKFFDLVLLRDYFYAQMPLTQIKELLKHWHTTSDKDLNYHVQRLFANRKAAEFKEIVDECLTLGIDILGVIGKTKERPCQPSLCGAYALHILDSSDSDDDKISRLVDLVKGNLNPMSDKDWKDEYRQFSIYLANNCKADQLSTILLSYRKMGSSQRLAESLLITILENPPPNREKIKKAFGTYWSYEENYRIFQPRCSWKILPYIKTEEMLQDIYSSIDPNMEPRKKLEIEEILKNEQHYNDFGSQRTYRVGLAQDVIDKIIP